MLDESRPNGHEKAPPSPYEAAMLDEPPIDLVHLSRQCQGSEGLEAELLDLFKRLAVAEAAQLSDPGTGLRLKADVAHKLRGSALAVGAGRVARAAETVEALTRGRGEEAPSRVQATKAQDAIAALQRAVAEAIGEIERLRG